MKQMLFATVNGEEIKGEDILNHRKRLCTQNENEDSFIHTPNEENNPYFNTEALQSLIDFHALVALAKFEGIVVSEEEVSEAIYQLRSSYEDSVEWEIALEELGVDDKNIRNIFYLDKMVHFLIQSHLENFEDPDNDSAEEFYYQNQEAMKIPNSYSFIEIVSSDTDQLKLVASIIAEKDRASITKKAEEHNLEIMFNEDIPHHKLPEPLQEMLCSMEEQKIGTMPLEDGSFVVIKLLRKILGKELSLEESISGLIEYLKFQQYKTASDDLTVYALEQCDVVYHNTEQLKNLY